MRASNAHDSVRLLLFRQIKVADIASVNFSADDLELVAIRGAKVFPCSLGSGSHFEYEEVSGSFAETKRKALLLSSVPFIGLLLYERDIDSVVRALSSTRTERRLGKRCSVVEQSCKSHEGLVRLY